MKIAHMTSTLPSIKASASLLNTASARFARPAPTPLTNHHGAARMNAGKMKHRIRILLADDHPLVRQGIGSLLSRQPNLEIVGEAGDGREALAKIREVIPDMVLLDIDMPHMSGLAVAEILRKELPQIRVLILSMHQQPEYVLRILESGAQGYVLKESPVEELVKAIEAVNVGETYFAPDIAKVALNQFVSGNGNGPDLRALTQREREVLIHVAEGCSNKEIAQVLNVGVRTVETHRERIMRKLDIHSIAGLTRFAIAKGMITLREDIRR
jgi:two-component system, NarL family, nitrate/nitrite response regulator NarL